MMFGGRKETEILLSCAQHWTNFEKTAGIRGILMNGVDWEYLLRIAGRHGLMPLLFHHLNSICPEAVPGPVLSRLRNHFNANLGYNRFLTGELLRLLNLFENYGIPAVPFKGPVLASSVYGDLSLREFSDLDILIRKGDFMNVKNLLLSEGYVSVDWLNPTQEKALMGLLYDYHFTHSKTGVNIDIHWGFVPKKLASTINTDRLWSSIQTARLGGKEIPTLSPEDLLLILCLHGYNHCWEALEWISDVAGLIEIHQEMNWALVAEETRRLGVSQIVFLGLYLAKSLLNVNLPDVLWQKVKSDMKVRSLALGIYRHLFQDRDKSLGILEKFLFHIKSTNLWGDRIQYCFYFLIPPTSRDYKILELPSSLFFLYYLLRSLRLLGKYSVGRLINSLPAATASISKE